MIPMLILVLFLGIIFWFVNKLHLRGAKKTLEILPRDSSSLLIMGREYLNQGKYEDAKNCLRKIQTNFKADETKILLGIAFYFNREFSNATQTLQDIVKKYENSTVDDTIRAPSGLSPKLIGQAFFCYGDCLEFEGRSDQAKYYKMQAEDKFKIEKMTALSSIRGIRENGVFIGKNSEDEIPENEREQGNSWSTTDVNELGVCIHKILLRDYDDKSNLKHLRLANLVAIKLSSVVNKKSYYSNPKKYLGLIEKFQKELDYR